MIPDWLTWVITFSSGAAGVFAGLKVGIAKLEANYVNLRAQVDESKAILRHQVGMDRCDKYREDCQVRIEKTLDRIEKQVEMNGEYVGKKLGEIAVYMAKHNGN